MELKTGEFNKKTCNPNFTEIILTDWHGKYSSVENGGKHLLFFKYKKHVVIYRYFYTPFGTANSYINEIIAFIGPGPYSYFYIKGKNMLENQASSNSSIKCGLNHLLH